MRTRTINLKSERLRGLPQRAEETWQAAAFRAPLWVQDDERQPPYRPWMALCISTRTGQVGMARPGGGTERPSRLVLDAVDALATNADARYRPGGVEVKQADVAAELRPLLDDVGIAVTERAELPEFEIAYRDLREFVLESFDEPAALDVKGVTIEHLRTFADAACEFHAAAPWRPLAGDLVEVISPKPQAGLRFATVMGSGGLECGLGFFQSRRQYERMFESPDSDEWSSGRGTWSFTFSEPQDVPFQDLDVWEEQGLPLPVAGLYPWLARFTRQSVQRPTPKQWAFVEGLLRAVARTSEAEMDSGRWTKTVETIEGPKEYVLALPTLTDPVERPSPGFPDRRVMERTLVDMERAARGQEFASDDELNAFMNERFAGQPVPHQPAQTPLERAQDLAYEAVEARGRRQLQLIRQALETCRDCADAYVLLAERESDPERMRELYAEGVAAGERTLGPTAFEEDAGAFWGILETRPYMRAKFGLAQCLESEGQFDEAATHYKELVRLNPNDNQGARFSLAGCYLRAGRIDELEELLAQYDDHWAQWTYISALAAYIQEGDSAKARERLAAAHEANRKVRKYLLGTAPLPETPPFGFRPGHEDEAVMVASEMIDIWESTPGALDWLREQTKSTKPKRRRRRK